MLLCPLTRVQVLHRNRYIVGLTARTIISYTGRERKNREPRFWPGKPGFSNAHSNARSQRIWQSAVGAGLWRSPTSETKAQQDRSNAHSNAQSGLPNPRLAPQSRRSPTSEPRARRARATLTTMLGADCQIRGWHHRAGNSRRTNRDTDEPEQRSPQRSKRIAKSAVVASELTIPDQERSPASQASKALALSRGMRAGFANT
jgi:hypothetical protein